MILFQSQQTILIWVKTERYDNVAMLALFAMLLFMTRKKLANKDGSVWKK